MENKHFYTRRAYLDFSREPFFTVGEGSRYRRHMNITRASTERALRVIGQADYVKYMPADQYLPAGVQMNFYGSCPNT